MLSAICWATLFRPEGVNVVQSLKGREFNSGYISVNMWLSDLQITWINFPNSFEPQKKNTSSILV